jgi:16S rRNA (adenine1518-N6/adenine1519-N6)-dimethyltransferase
MPRRPYGQHFLADQGVLRRIVDAAELSPDDWVVEVGPGRGALTRELVSRAAHVVAVEVDAQLASSLSQRLGKPPNLTVMEADARSVDLESLAPGGQAYKVVANLPYYAANPILRRFLEAEHKPTLLVILVQKEVAEAIVARPGEMSMLSVAVQFYGSPRLICDVPPQAFNPPPEVVSSVLRIDVLPKPAVEVDDADAFFRLVHGGFVAPRKQIRNSLSIGLKVVAAEVEGLLSCCAVEPSRRPATLSMAEWACLYRAYAKDTIHAR